MGPQWIKSSLEQLAGSQSKVEQGLFSLQVSLRNIHRESTESGRDVFGTALHISEPSEQAFNSHFKLIHRTDGFTWHQNQENACWGLPDHDTRNTVSFSREKYVFGRANGILTTSPECFTIQVIRK